jgi:hypothetical protein
VENKNICLFTRYEIIPNEVEKKIKFFFDKKINVNVFTLEDKKNNYNNFHNIQFTKYEDLKNILNIIKNEKYDILNFRNLIKKKSIRYKTDFVLINTYLYEIFLTFKIQKKNGNCIFNFKIFNIIFDFLLILKKYYNKIKIISEYEKCNIATLNIICLDFKGISKKELDEFENVIKEVSKKNDDYLNYPRDDYLFLHSILKQTPEIKLEIEKIKNLLSNDLNKLLDNNIEYMNLLISIKKNIDENKHTNKKKVAHLENVLYKRQVSEFIFIFNSIVNGIKNK